MDVDQMISLAERIASGLPEVTRTEWNKWAQIAEHYGLEKAVRWADHMSVDITLRPAIQRANKLISSTLRMHLSVLKSLPGDQQRQVWGYVSRVLAVNTLRPDMRTNAQQPGKDEHFRSRR